MSRRPTVAIGLSGVLLLAVSALLAGVALRAQPSPAQAPSSEDTVQLEWLGWMFFRLTSPSGQVVLTSPYLLNPDSPYTLDDLDRVDLILVPNAHGDDMGQTLDIASKTGARVIAPDPLARWMVSRGLTRAQVTSSSIGDVHTVDGIRVRVVHNLHDNSLLSAQLPDEPTFYAGPAQGYIVTFQNGLTVYFAASSAIHMDMQLFGSLYKPHVALLNLSSSRDPVDVAHMARLLLTDNPNLRTVIPQHYRVGDPRLAQIAAEIQRLGLPVRFLTPAILEPHTFGGNG
jgi:L-ascorbate metabolism protein UlaG (beta-lactamase superfamily)